MFNLRGELVNERFDMFSAAGANDWQTWRKPAWASLFFIMARGPGGNGGAGFSGASGTARGGGGGGGFGATASFLLPSRFLPDILRIRVGLPGIGTVIATDPAASNVLQLVNAPTGGNGGAGTASAAGTAGTNGSISVTWSALGAYTVGSGTNATAGGAQTGAVGVALTAAFPITGGSGGAGVGTADAAFAGGSLITGFGGTLISSGAGARGIDGLILQRPFVVTGGSGGASNGTGVGGDGGDGAYGSGGGGGGGGVTGGAGGKGGAGFALILPIK